MNKNPKYTCPVCENSCALLDVVDFNKSCEEIRGKYLEISGTPIYYALCSDCGFCYSPEISAWSLHDFEREIYNDQYIVVDPDYVEARPRTNAGNLIAMFEKQSKKIKHLDYGGGDGFLSKLLCESGWNSTPYDPFVNKEISLKQIGTFDLITAFEVFEHVPDIHILMSNLRSLLTPDGVVLFSTLVSDGQIHKNQRLSWWYASPRNGHISLFSKKSLSIIGKQYGFNIGSFSDGFHVFWTTVPNWATHIIR